MKPSGKSRLKTRIGIASFVVLIGFGLASVLQALPIGSTGYDDIFYSDSSFTTQVGERYRDCDDSRDNWGIRTQFVEAYQWDCQTDQFIGADCTFWVCSDVTDNPSSFNGCNCVF